MTIYLRERYNSIAILSAGVGILVTSLTGLLLATLYPDWQGWQYMTRIVPIFFIASSMTLLIEVKKLQVEFSNGTVVDNAKAAVGNTQTLQFAFDESDTPYNVSGQLHSMFTRDPQRQHASPEALTRKLTGKLLRDCLKVNGGGSNQLCGWRQLDIAGYKWYPSTWSIARKALRHYTYTVSGRNGGTFCSDKYATLLELYDAWGKGQLELS